MIIKSKSVKSKIETEKVLRYILTKENNQLGFVFSKDIRGDRKFNERTYHDDQENHLVISEERIQNMLIQFEENNQKRLIPRKNGNRAYHEIVSFHRSDSHKLSEETLMKVAHKYAKERSPHSLTVVGFHKDRSHFHLHFLFSSVEFGTGRVARLSKSDFHKVKQTMESYKSQELGLEFSQVDHSGSKKSPPERSRVSNKSEGKTI